MVYLNIKCQSWKMNEKFAFYFIYSVSCFGILRSCCSVDCFESNLKYVRFELQTFYNSLTKWSGSVVKHQNHNHAIPLVDKEVLEETVSENVPARSTTISLEVLAGKITGEYRMVSQGVNIYSMIYMNYRTGNKSHFFFDPNIESSLETGCS